MRMPERDGLVLRMNMKVLDVLRELLAEGRTEDVIALEP